jgi:hypothetical protein
VSRTMRGSGGVREPARPSGRAGHRSNSALGLRSRADDVTAAVRCIADQSREVLVDAWVEAYGRPPPKGISRRLLQYAAAYHLQARAFGGLSSSTRRKLDQALQPPSNETAAPARAERAAPLPTGSRLVREWNGRVHTVDVVDSRFHYNGRSYRSLSEIARVITGTRWSGPRFFGL